VSSNQGDQQNLVEGYVKAYDAARRLHARQTAEHAAEQAAFVARGVALHKIKEFARVAFMLVPEATEAAFDQLWRQAFYVNQLKSGHIL
jgi:hypothetical protein